MRVASGGRGAWEAIFCTFRLFGEHKAWACPSWAFETGQPQHQSAAIEGWLCFWSKLESGHFSVGLGLVGAKLVNTFAQWLPDPADGRTKCSCTGLSRFPKRISALLAQATFSLQSLTLSGVWCKFRKPLYDRKQAMWNRERARTRISHERWPYEKCHDGMTRTQRTTETGAELVWHAMHCSAL